MESGQETRESSPEWRRHADEEWLLATKKNLAHFPGPFFRTNKKILELLEEGQRDFHLSGPFLLQTIG